MAINEMNELRKQAEEFLSAFPGGHQAINVDDLKTLLHELSVYQIELEMQNQSLKETYQQLVVAKNSFSQLFELAPVGYLKLDQNGWVHKANQTLQEMLNLSSRQLEGHYFANFIHPEDLNIFNSRFRAFFRKPENKRIELRLLKYNGPHLQIEMSGRLINETPFPEGKNSDYLLVTVHEIGDRKRLEDELILAAKVFENSDEGIMITDEKNRILNINRSFTSITGFDASEVIGKSPRIFRSGHHDPNFYKEMWAQLMTNGRWQGEIWNIKRNGDAYIAWLSITSVTDMYGKIKHFIAIFSDITQRKQQEKQIKLLAHYDLLTKLPNRVLFSDRLNQAIMNASRLKEYLAILFLDLDRFKLLNDTYGHLAGDILLQDVANRLTACVRETDTVCRFGGDEFIILLTHFKDQQTAVETSQQIAEKLSDELAKPYSVANTQFITSASIGISLFPSHGTSAAELIKNADSAMYYAKDAGRNNYQHYTEEMRKNALIRSSIEHDLINALPQQQFDLVYQPFVELSNDGLFGFEALIRWHHPNKGLLLPEAFLRIAEETGLIDKMGLWVLERACRQLSAWHQQGNRELKMSVNLSSRQFLNAGLFDDIQQILHDTHVPGSALILEITESMMMQNMGEAIRVMHRLKSLGVLLSLDDFGTGYSSLAYLKKFPLDILKIDQSFIQDLANDPDDKMLIKSIIDIAQNMDLLIIAEGIENQGQLEFLNKHGCQVGQGFLFSIPLPSTKLELRYKQLSMP